MSDSACFEIVKAGELAQVRERRQALKLSDAPKQPSAADETGDPHLMGLCLSGGGIRSATFGLGVLQHLADTGLLKHIDYLSTVSGGGYIGAWLTSWIKRSGLNDVLKKLKPNKAPEPPEIAFLRQYSNYLTPRVSMFSADTWLVAAIWSRNTLLNLGILVALFACIFLVVRALGLLFSMRGPQPENELGVPLLTSTLLLLPMIRLMCSNLSQVSTIALGSCSTSIDRSGESKDRKIIWFTLFPLASAIAYSHWLMTARGVFVDKGLWAGTQANFIVLSVVFLVIQFSTKFHTCFLAKHSSRSWGTYLRLAALYVVGPLASGFATACLIRVVALLIDIKRGDPAQPWFALTIGAPLILIAFAVGVVVHVGLMGRDLPDASREWLGRLRGWMLIASVGWILVVGVGIYGPYLVSKLGVSYQKTAATLGSGWILTTILGLFAGKSSGTDGRSANGTASRSRKISKEVVAHVAPYLFILGFGLAVSFGVHAILAHELTLTRVTPFPEAQEVYNLQVRGGGVHLSRDIANPKDTGLEWVLDRYWKDLSGTELIVADSKLRWALSGLLPLFGVLFGAGLLLSLRVDINDFSMHHFYKNRLVRSYLGASRWNQRKPNPFTGFDDCDDYPLADFTCSGATHPYLGPYPIVNAALNISSGGQLQYQERKAISFVFTPLYTGFGSERPNDEMRLLDSASAESADLLHAYLSTKTMVRDGGIKVGTAMAISGAAVSPNMGYHTSTAVAFLLTAFNVRLGWWLANPSKRTSAYRESPPLGFLYSFAELFGVANINRDFVNLSDGGHFDNMGIYELVRRRCKYIICCDGEQDTDMHFGGIGNAIRKCRTDFGVEITLPLDRLKKADGFSRVHCVVGTVMYPSSNGDAAMQGYLVYLKSSLTGDEPSDVLEYNAREPEFPHQSTGDQWFDESQFESYRRLGLHVAESVFSSVSIGNTLNREEFFRDLYHIWFPPSPAVEKHSADHADIYARVMDGIRREEELKCLDPHLFAGWNESMDECREAWRHNSSHMCNSMIHLMQRVFYDLNLENPNSREHPFVQGWLHLFEHWAGQDIFVKTWAVTGRSYPERFRHFYNYVLTKGTQRQEFGPDGFQSPSTNGAGSSDLQRSS